VRGIRKGWSSWDEFGRELEVSNDGGDGLLLLHGVQQAMALPGLGQASREWLGRPLACGIEGVRPRDKAKQKSARR